MKLYIAGPITNRPNCNKDAFDEAVRTLSRSGHSTINPLDYTAENMPWIDCMRIVIPQMLMCDGVALLDKWYTSRGATIECELAHRLDMPVKDVGRWL